MVFAAVVMVVNFESVLYFELFATAWSRLRVALPAGTVLAASERPAYRLGNRKDVKPFADPRPETLPLPSPDGTRYNCFIRSSG